MISSQRSGPSVWSLFARTRTATGGPGFAGAAIRILIVDDIEAWQSIYIEVLRRHTDWQIDGIARTAVEAVRKSRELQPDVVLLDVGLGRVDRLEAARQIREVSPASRFLLLGTCEPSQLAEITVASEAYGYIVKRDVVLDLVPAMQALAQGRPFPGRKSS